MSNIILLPSRFNCAAIHQFSQSIVGLNGFPTYQEIVFDFRYLSFIDGAGLTVFCNAIEWLFSHNVKVSGGNYGITDYGPTAYLDDCGFFEKYQGTKLRPHGKIRTTTLPFERVAHVAAHFWLENTFTPWVAKTLNVSHDALGSLSAAIKEIFHNIIDHSTMNDGFIHVQYYPSLKQIGITVSDIGKEIPNNVRECTDPNLNDAQAIMRATENGYTTKSRPNNMGAGLDFLISNITSNKGSVSIYSYYGLVNCKSTSDGEVDRVSFLGTAPYPGTLIDITIPTSTFVGDDETEGNLIW